MMESPAGPAEDAPRSGEQESPELHVGIRWQAEDHEWGATGRFEAVVNLFAALRRRNRLRLRYYHLPWESLADQRAPEEICALDTARPAWDVWYSPHCDVTDAALLTLRNSAGHRAPVVYSIHGLPFGAEQFCGGALAAGRFRPYDAIITTSRRSQRSFQSFVESLGRPGPRVELIPWGVDGQLFERAQSRRDGRLRLGIAEDRVVGLYFGRISPMLKADILPLLAEVARRRSELARSRFVLCIAGYFRERWYEQEVRELIAERGLAEMVVLAGPIQREERALLYAAADFAVNLSDVAVENQHLVAFECLAAGLPQIAADWDGLSDAVVDGENGYLVDTYWDDIGADLVPLLDWCKREERCHILAQSVVIDMDILGRRLVELAANERLRAAMSASARAHAEAYRWEIAGERYERLFGELTEQARLADPPREQPFAHLRWQGRRLDTARSATLAASGLELARGERRIERNDYLGQAYPERVISRIVEAFAARGSLSLADLLATLAAEDRGPATRVFLHLLKHGHIAWV
ncbi:glycosyltransferase [Nannocystis radixulma]|uniref:Glycosyltransferase n=1 Tax=Nannocystis radixulma TaxID=2995305 RepID=A0ABT5B5U7_9BACT|nr:glycosyltransferase [Nannocystis radixulma]MDC0669467.1 glycosyltransferase [Nannocystis radixulma]